MAPVALLLARTDDTIVAHRFRVAHVMDVDEQVAAVVAARADAQSTTQLDTLLEDPEVDVVAICSPDRFHAGQVAAVAAAGKRAILCEKPLATTVEEAQRIADVSVTSGVPVLVGAMHAYDPAWTAARQQWGILAQTSTLAFGDLSAAQRRVPRPGDRSGGAAAKLSGVPGAQP